MPELREQTAIQHMFIHYSTSGRDILSLRNGGDWRARPKAAVGIDGEDFGQCDAHFPAPAERFRRMVLIVRADAQAGQYDLLAAFLIVTTATFEFGLNVAVALRQIGNGCFRLLHLPAELHRVFRSGNDLLQSKTTAHVTDIA